MEIAVANARKALSKRFFYFAPFEEDSFSEYDALLIFEIDDACRHYATHEDWPPCLSSFQYRAIAQRLSFASMIVGAMQTAMGKEVPDPSLHFVLPPKEPAQLLNWLLIWAWKAGGANLMLQYRQILFSAFTNAGMVCGFEVDSLQPRTAD